MDNPMPITIGNKTENDFSNPLGLLSDCHRRIERFLDVLIAVAKQVRGAELDGDHRSAFAIALRYFREAAPKHTLDEEESLFPRMLASPDARARSAVALLDELRSDHVLADTSHKVVEGLGNRWLSKGVLSNQAFDRLTRLLDQLHSTYQRHIASEDQEVFPLASQLLDTKELATVGLEMARRRLIDLNAHGIELTHSSGHIQAI
jgi:hemerythrin-like domain-containing protein